MRTAHQQSTDNLFVVSFEGRMNPLVLFEINLMAKWLSSSLWHLLSPSALFGHYCRSITEFCVSQFLREKHVVVVHSWKDLNESRVFVFLSFGMKMGFQKGDLTPFGLKHIIGWHLRVSSSSSRSRQEITSKIRTVLSGAGMYFLYYSILPVPLPHLP